jgi:hypothetical protein
MIGNPRYATEQDGIYHQYLVALWLGRDNRGKSLEHQG